MLTQEETNLVFNNPYGTGMYKSRLWCEKINDNIFLNLLVRHAPGPHTLNIHLTEKKYRYIKKEDIAYISKNQGPNSLWKLWKISSNFPSSSFGVDFASNEEIHCTSVVEPEQPQHFAKVGAEIWFDIGSGYVN
jgi:hypothetical protein